MVRGQVRLVARYIRVGRYGRAASGRPRRVGETFTVGSLVDDVGVTTILTNRRQNYKKAQYFSFLYLNKAK